MKAFSDKRETIFQDLENSIYISNISLSPLHFIDISPHRDYPILFINSEDSMQQRLKTFIHITLFITFLSALLYVNTTVASDETYERMIKDEQLVVGMSGEQPPFNFVSKQGQTVGYDVDLAMLLGESLDIDIRIELMPFPELVPALKNHQIDVIISGFAFSEQRSKVITFVGPYALSGKSLLTTKEKLQKIQTSTGFNHKDIRLMALDNSTSETFAETKLSNAKLTTIKHYEDALLALSSNETDALIADLSFCELAVIRDKAQQLTVPEIPLAVEEVGIAINKNEPLLEKRLSDLLRTFHSSGDLKTLHEKWFNTPGWLALLP